MKKKPDSVILIVALAGLVVAGIITTSIINAVKNNGSGTDIRARAGVTNTLKLEGTVSGINETDGTVIIDNVQFAAESRSGKPVNYGTWTVTPPTAFSLSSATPGRSVSFTVNSDAFDVATRKVVAAAMTVK